MEAINKFGTDKPDLRNPLIINDITEVFSLEDVKFDIFKNLVKKGNKVKCILTKKTKDKPRSFFDSIDNWAKEQGASGLAYFTFEKDQKIKAKGPVGKFFGESSQKIMQICNAEIGDSLFLSCGKRMKSHNILSQARTKIAEELRLIDENQFVFCWIVDYPMFEMDEKTNKIIFSHNPFSMPQGI